MSLDGFFYQMGEIWTIKKTITMTDNLDRHHSYVMWRHTVNFSNWGTNHEHWVHKRRSRIHRTAISARCRVVKRFALKLLPQFKPNDPENYVTYTDELPFGWDDLNNNRRPLCEYCFFGGPDKLIPFPKEDSF